MKISSINSESYTHHTINDNGIYLQECKRSLGKVITTADGHSYVHSKMTDDYIYLKCAIFRTGCKGTCKLNRVRSLITPMKQHNHSVKDYKAMFSGSRESVKQSLNNPKQT